MVKRQFRLTEGQVQELIRAHDRSTHDLTRIRLLAVRLYGTGTPAPEVRERTGCSQASLMVWCRKYRQQGAEGLADRRSGGNRAKLTEVQIEELGERLQECTPGELFGPQAATPNGCDWTVEDLQRAIEEWYGVIYKSRTSYYQLFARCGFAHQRQPHVLWSCREAGEDAEEGQAG